MEYPDSDYVGRCAPRIMRTLGHAELDRQPVRRLVDAPRDQKTGSRRRSFLSGEGVGLSFARPATRQHRFEQEFRTGLLNLFFARALDTMAFEPDNLHQHFLTARAEHEKRICFHCCCRFNRNLGGLYYTSASPRPLARYSRRDRRGLAG